MKSRDKIAEMIILAKQLIPYIHSRLNHVTIRDRVSRTRVFVYHSNTKTGRMCKHVVYLCYVLALYRIRIFCFEIEQALLLDRSPNLRVIAPAARQSVILLPRHGRYASVGP